MYGYLDADNTVVRTADYKLAKEMTGGVSKKLVRDYIGKYCISTVFIIIDSGTLDDPIFFETALFPVESGNIKFDDLYSIRTGTYGEAMEAHQSIISEVQNGTLP